MNDPRKGLPSASGAQQLALCPVSFRRSQGLPDIETEYSVSGDRIHLKLAKQDSSVVLSPKEQEDYDRCEGHYAHFMATLGLVARETRVENRLWLEIGGQKFCSGQYDRLAICEDGTVVVVDFKTGYKEVEAATSNLQLRWLAVLVNQAYQPRGNIVAAIIAPNNFGRPVTAVTYSKEHIALAEQEMLSILTKSQEPNAPANPGPTQCTYCKAKPVCNEYQQWVRSVLPAKAAELPVEKYWTPEQWVSFFTVLPQAEKGLSDRKEQARKLLTDNPNAIPGLVLKPSGSIRQVSDVNQAYLRLQKTLTAPQFIECCSVSIPDLERAYKNARGVTAKQAKTDLESVLSGLVESKEKKPSVKVA